MLSASLVKDIDFRSGTKEEDVTVLGVSGVGGRLPAEDKSVEGTLSPVGVVGVLSPAELEDPLREVMDRIEKRLLPLDAGADAGIVVEGEAGGAMVGAEAEVGVEVPVAGTDADDPDPDTPATIEDDIL